MFVIGKRRNKQNHCLQKGFSFQNTCFLFYAEKYHADNVQIVGISVPFLQMPAINRRDSTNCLKLTLLTYC